MDCPALRQNYQVLKLREGEGMRLGEVTLPQTTTAPTKVEQFLINVPQFVVCFCMSFTY